MLNLRLAVLLAVVFSVRDAALADHVNLVSSERWLFAVALAENGFTDEREVCCKENDLYRDDFADMIESFSAEVAVTDASSVGEASIVSKMGTSSIRGHHTARVAGSSTTQFGEIDSQALSLTGIAFEVTEAIPYSFKARFSRFGDHPDVSVIGSSGGFSLFGENGGLIHGFNLESNGVQRIQASGILEPGEYGVISSLWMYGDNFGNWKTEFDAQLDYSFSLKLPEPTSGVLAMLGGFLVCKRRRAALRRGFGQ